MCFLFYVFKVIYLAKVTNGSNYAHFYIFNVFIDHFDSIIFNVFASGNLTS